MTQIDLYGTLQAQQTLEAELLLSASTGATDNYEQLKNRPSINGVVLSGDKSSEDLFLASAQGLADEQLARENADNALSQRIDNGALTAQAQGSSFTLTDAASDCGLYSLYVSGNSSQNGIPTPDAPIEIDSIGDSGSLSVTTDNGGEISTTATITSALPLCSVGDVKDELIFNADGTAKVIKRLFSETVTFTPQEMGDGVRYLANLSQMPSSDYLGLAMSDILPYNNAANVGTNGIRTAMGQKLAVAYYNGTVLTTANIVYPLATPEEINLTADEAVALLSLETFEGLTNVFSSDNAQMSVEYWRNQALGSLLTSISRSTNLRLTALENAIIGG